MILEKKIKRDYKKTPVGIIPEDWEVKRFEELAKRSSKRFDPTTNESKKDLELDSFEQGTGRILNVYDSKDYKSSKNFFKEGDVLFGKLRPYLRKYWRATFDGVCSSEVWVFQNKKSILSEYLYLTLQTEYFINKSQITSGTKMPRAEWSSVKNAKLPIPPLPEQKAIADCLSTWDRAIEKQTQLIHAKKEFKKGLMQGFFNGQLSIINDQLVRAKEGEDFTKDWEEVRLGDVIKLQGGYAFKSKKFKKEGIPIIRISNLSAEKGMVDLTDLVYYDKIETNQFWIEQGDLLIAMSGATTGKTAVYQSKNKAYLNQRVGHFKNKDGNIFTYEFLYYIVDNELFKNEIDKMLSTGAQPNISGSEIESIKLKLPKVAVQTAIAQVLHSADKEIEILEQQLEQLQLQKKGLMQVLLTGKKRLI